MSDNSVPDPEATLVPSNQGKRKRDSEAGMERERVMGEGAPDDDVEPRAARKKTRRFEPRNTPRRPVKWHLKKADIPDGASRTKVMSFN